MADDVEMVEPCAVARMARNGWLAVKIAETLHMTMPEVGKALQDADAAEKGIPKQRIVTGKLK
ncbi:hypothetical protein [Williamsia serinedens]|uniref:Gp68-like predicted RNA polymerase component domain-containing protein n=1 Tax=Williamsia serinedens TaxID=391736 RepID=A0ABT1H7I6_9NOCA|nr:hypothetical protein [Williamsia serinedens]MCP2163136.1 hypothetical protein [Williamsia serinedens]